MGVMTGRATRARQLAELAHDTPEVVIDLDVVEANVRSRAQRARDAGVALRPHTKTHKLPQIARLQLDSGAAGIMVAKLGEAEVMAAAGIDDILVGLPIVGAAKVARLIALAERCAITATVDSWEIAEPLARAARARGLVLPCVLEVDTGLARTGVAPGPAALELAERLATLDGIDLAGLLTHEGHVYTASADAAERARLTRAACARVVETAESIRARGVPVTTVSVGSSGTFAAAIECPGVTEVRPGTYVFNDRTQLALGAATPEELAAVVVVTVVSRVRPGEIVIDAGTKALTSDRMLVRDPPPTFGQVLGEGCEVVRLSEEHGVVAVPESCDAHVGDRLAIVPNHICPVVNLHEHVTVVRGSASVDRWPVAARGRLQ